MGFRPQLVPALARPRSTAVALLLAGAALAQAGAGVRVADAAALVRAVEDGGVVTLEPGEYDLENTLVLHGEVELRADRPGTVRLNLRGAPVGVSIEPGAHVRIARVGLAYAADAPGDLLRVHDATLILDEIDAAFAVAGGDPGPDRPDGLGAGLVVTGSAEATVTGGGFGRHGGRAIEARDAARLSLDAVVLVNNGAGVLIAGEARLEMRGGEIRSHEGAALEVRDAARAHLDSVAVEDGGTPHGAVPAVLLSGVAEARFDDVVLAFHPGVALTASERSSVRLFGSTFSDNALDVRVVDAAIVELDGVRVTGPATTPTQDRRDAASEPDTTPDGTGSDR